MRIENQENTLTKLLQRVQDDKARTEDYLAPTNSLRFIPENAPGAETSPRLIIESEGGVPTAGPGW